MNNLNTVPTGHYAPLHLVPQVDLCNMPPTYSDFFDVTSGNHQQNALISDQRPMYFEHFNDGTRFPMTGSDFSLNLRPSVSEICGSRSMMSGVGNNQGVPFSLQLQPHLQRGCSQLSSENISSSPHIKNQDYSRDIWYQEQVVPDKRNVSKALSCSADNQKRRNRSNKQKKEKVKRARFIKPGCAINCRKRCKEKISQSVREDLFNAYWNLDDENLKKAFIGRNALKMPMIKCLEGTRRSFSVDWAFTVNGESYSVCKLFFLHTLDIPENTAYAALKDSEFASNEVPIIRGKAKVKEKLPVWFETDLDDYSCSKKKESSLKVDRTAKNYVRDMRPGCKLTCRKKCHSKLSYDQRLSIFQEYLRLTNIRKQREYISKLITKTEKKRVRATDSTRRGCSIEWTLMHNAHAISVCKTFFLHTLGISERTAYNIAVKAEIQPVERKIPKGRKSTYQVLRHMLNSPNTRNQSMARVKKKFVNSSKAIKIVAKGKLRSAVRMCRSRARKTLTEDSDDWCDDFQDADIDALEKALVKQENTKSSKVKSSSLKLPLKKRGRQRQTKETARIPILKIQKGKIVSSGTSSLSQKKRGPYKRRKMTKQKHEICPENCSKQCRQHLSEEARNEIHKEYWALTNMDEQRQFLTACVKKEAKQTCSCLIANKFRGKRRGYRIHWTLNFRGLEVPVCKVFFMHVLQVSDNIVYRAIHNAEEFITGPVKDCRHFTGEAIPLQPEEGTQQLQCVVTCENGMGDAVNPGVLNREEKRTCTHSNLSPPLCESETVCENTPPDHQRNSPVLNSNYRAVQEDGSNPPAQKKYCISTASNIDIENQVPSCKNDRISDGLFIPYPDSMKQNSHFPTLRNMLNPGDIRNQNMTQCQGYERDIPGLLHWQNGNTNPNRTLCKPVVDCYSSHNAGSMPVFPTFTDIHMDSMKNDAVYVHSRAVMNNTFSQLKNPQTALHHNHFECSSSMLPSSSHNQNSHLNFHQHTTSNIRYMTHAVDNVFPPSGLPAAPASSQAYPPFNACQLPSHDALPNQDIFLAEVLRNTKSELYLSSSSQPSKGKKRIRKQIPVAKYQEGKLKEPQAKKTRRTRRPLVKHIKSGCSESCRKKCNDRLPYNTREELFNAFWNLENDKVRRHYVLQHVKKLPKKTCSGVESRRCCSIDWRIKHNGETYSVCKRFFLDTFDIGEKFVSVVLKKSEIGNMEDLRGRHNKRSRAFISEKAHVEKHIRSVATLKAFRCLTCGKDFTRWCLNTGVIVSQLYRQYANQRKFDGGKPACRSSYNSILQNDFCIKLSPDQGSVCNQCSPLLPTAPQDVAAESATSNLHK